MQETKNVEGEGQLSNGRLEVRLCYRTGSAKRQNISRHNGKMIAYHSHHSHNTIKNTQDTVSQLNWTKINSNTGVSRTARLAERLAWTNQYWPQWQPMTCHELMCQKRCQNFGCQIKFQTMLMISVCVQFTICSSWFFHKTIQHLHAADTVQTGDRSARTCVSNAR